MATTKTTANTKTTTSSTTTAPKGSLSMNIGGQTIVATPTSSTTAAQVKAAQDQGWTSYSGPVSTGGKSVKGGESLAPLLENMSDNTVITGDILSKNIQPLALPQNNQNGSASNYNSLITNNNASLGPIDTKGNIKESLDLALNPSKNDSTDTLSSYFKDYLSLRKEPESQASIYERALKDTQVQEKRQLANNLTGQINAIVAKSQADQLAVTGQGRGVPEVIIGGQQAQIAKEAAIQALPIQAQLAAAQGDLKIAEDHLDTLFKLRSADATAKNDYYNKTLDAVYGFATKKEEMRLDELRAEKNANTEAVKLSIQFARDLSKEAMKNGQGSVSTAISQLTPPNPNSRNFASDLIKYNSEVARLQGNIRGTTETQITQYGEGTALINSRTGEPIRIYPGKLAKSKEEDEVDKQSIIDKGYDKISEIDKLLESKDYVKVVGKSPAGRTPVNILGIWGSEASGQAQRAQGAIKQLASQEFVDYIIDVKSRGATFGNLSDKDADDLRAASTKIRGWEVKDPKTGVGTGTYNVSEEDFAIELKKIKEITQRIITQARGITTSNPIGISIHGDALSTDSLELGI